MAGATGDVLLPSQVKMDDDSYELILKLMLEDSRQLAEGKGKQKEGNISDTEVAFNLYAKEIENALTIDADHRLVMSIQQALSTDANALTQLQDEERMAQHDHEVAIALSEGRDPPPMPTSPPAPDIVPEASLAHDPDAKPSLKRKAAKDTDHAQATKVPRTGDFDSARRSDKGKEPEHTHAQPAKRPRTETFDFRDETDDGKDLILHGKRARLGESSSWAANRQPPRNHRTCTSCIESTPELLLIRAPCQHEYCHDCIKSLFTLAMRDETLFPPKCCQQAIPAEQHARILGSNLVHLYHAKQIEFSTENRTYCHNTECGKFINSVDAGHCSSCGMRTCTSCKKVAHLGDCPQDAELHRILEMAEQKGWRRCTKCNSMVELSHGCNHMTLVILYPLKALSDDQS
ncbi:hypothetical protein N0V93_008285 [Gnomoniopsis smithogilvyi]|uniref:IBR domain-containing protein n=1 Tax=Gnomoniopsis smithogilvyi TaxID=1191159 RepID=A0A9W8YQ13_9PEZI|nr:hypothetical protein N0V93_008285 [Gnomoniopsis smithogilvyi]